MNNKSKFKATAFTTFFAIVNMLVLSIFNIIYNKLLIEQYGSSVNGLISTLNQFISIFTILEGGISIAAVVSTFEPFSKKNYTELNNILYTISKTFKKIAILFVIISSISGFVYIQFLEPVISRISMYALLLVTILTTTLSFIYISKYTIIISADNKGYIKYILSITSKTITWILSVILILNNTNIVLVYLMNFFNVLLNTIFLKKYEGANYKYITYKGNYNSSLIKGTKDVFFQKIASTIFTSTDLVLISVGISLASSSIYFVYNQIFHAIYSFIGSIIEAPFNSFGQLYGNKEYDKINSVFLVYLKTTNLISTILLSSVGMCFLSFIKIYTKNITDVNYIIPMLVYLFYSQYFFQLNNRPYGVLLNSAGLFHMQNLQCGLAAFFNIVVSLIFMKFWGISGVIFGSIIGTSIILFMNLIQCFKYVLNRKFIKELIILLLNYLFGVLLIFGFHYLNLSFDNYFIWGLYGLVCFICSILLVSIFNFIIDSNGFVAFTKYFFKKIKLRKN